MLYVPHKRLPGSEQPEDISHLINDERFYGRLEWSGGIKQEIQNCRSNQEI